MRKRLDTPSWRHQRIGGDIRHIGRNYDWLSCTSIRFVFRVKPREYHDRLRILTISSQYPTVVVNTNGTTCNLFASPAIPRKQGLNRQPNERERVNIMAMTRQRHNAFNTPRNFTQRGPRVGGKIPPQPSVKGKLGTPLTGSAHKPTSKRGV